MVIYLPRQPVWNYIEVYWPRAGELSALNAIEVRNCVTDYLDHLGTEPMAHGGIEKYMDAAAELGRNPVSKHEIQPEYGDEQDDARRDSRTSLTSLRLRVVSHTKERIYYHLPEKKKGEERKTREKGERRKEKGERSAR